MARSRLVQVSLVTAGATCLLLLVPGVAAASSVSGELIRGLNRRLLYMAVPIAVLVEVILVYAVLRFRNNETPEPTRENRQLEITWTVATGLILLFVGTASFTVLASPFVGNSPASSAGLGADGAGNGTEATAITPGNAPADAVEVVGVARQWEWRFEYPGSDAAADELVIPRDREVFVYVTSEDVIHSLHVPELGLKQDAFPGQYHLVRTRATGNGTYRLFCAEFCGTGHANMETDVHVVDSDEFQRWTAGNASLDAVANGTGTANAVGATTRVRQP